MKIYFCCLGGMFDINTGVFTKQFECKLLFFRIFTIFPNYILDGQGRKRNHFTLRVFCNF